MRVIKGIVAMAGCFTLINGHLVAETSQFSVFNRSPSQLYDSENRVETIAGVLQSEHASVVAANDAMTIDSKATILGAATSARIGKQMVAGLKAYQAESETELLFQPYGVKSDEPDIWESRVISIEPLLNVHVRNQVAIGLLYNYSQVKVEKQHSTERRLTVGGLYFAKEGELGLTHTPKYQVSDESGTSFGAPEWVLHGKAFINNTATVHGSMTRIQYASIGLNDRTTGDDRDVYTYTAGVQATFGKVAVIGFQGTHRSASYDSRDDINLFNITTNSLALEADWNTAPNIAFGVLFEATRGRETGSEAGEDWTVNQKEESVALRAAVSF